MTEAPPIRRWSERPSAYDGPVAPRRKPTADYASFGEYFAAEIEPNRKAAQFPPVRLGYPKLKRRR